MKIRRACYALKSKGVGVRDQVDQGCVVTDVPEVRPAIGGYSTPRVPSEHRRDLQFAFIYSIVRIFGRVCRGDRRGSPGLMLKR